MNVMIVGKTASGKTTFANALAKLCEEYGIPYILQEDEFDENIDIEPRLNSMAMNYNMNNEFVHISVMSVNKIKQ